MSNDNVKKALYVTRAILFPSSFLLEKLVETTSNAITKSEVVTQTEKLDEILAEAERQESALKMAEGQARVAQEIAIARRIETAEEVEIEEFYDYSGEGHAGVKTDGSTIGIGIGAAGKRVSRRVYRFKGGSITQPKDLQELLPESSTTEAPTES